MTQWRRPWLWLALALTLILITVAAFWLPEIFPDNDNRSPLSTDQPVLETGISPLHTPTILTMPEDAPSSWTGAGAVLLWTALGLVLAIGIALIFVRRYRRVE